MDRRTFLTGAFFSLSLPAGAGGRLCLRASASAEGDAEMPVCVMDRWFDAAEGADFQAPAALVKKLGFAGMALRGDAGDLEGRIGQLRKQGLDVPALMVSGAPGASLAGSLERLKGSKARIWMSIEIPGRGPSDPAGDPAAAEQLGACAELCRKAGLPGIGLLARPGTWLATTADALRMAERMDRPEVGIVFDLHTWMTEAPGGDPRRALDVIRSHLVGVLLNGSGKTPSVLPFSEGEFDAGPVVRALADLRYSGPVVFAAPERPGKTSELLEASLRKWESLRKGARENPPDRVRAHVYISGRVQGVSFRASTQSEAERLRVAGWVRNLDDGRVEAMFEGAREPLAELLVWCHTGPPAARVEKVDVTWEKPDGTLRTFEVRR